MRSIESRVTELVNQPVPTALLDVLARTQALVLYQIIRLFDGDISVLAAVQDTVPAMAASARVLGQYLTDDSLGELHVTTTETLDLSANANPYGPSYALLDNLPSTLFSQNVSLHYNWLLQESARRTYLIAFFLLQIYRMLVLHIGFPPRRDTKMHCRSFTISSHLWNASDSVSFASAWRDKKYFIFRGDNINDVLLSLRGDDVDQFSKMVLTMLLGVEEVKGWLVGRGGVL